MCSDPISIDVRDWIRRGHGEGEFNRRMQNEIWLFVQRYYARVGLSDVFRHFKPPYYSELHQDPNVSVTVYYRFNYETNRFDIIDRVSFYVRAYEDDRCTLIGRGYRSATAYAI